MASSARPLPGSAAAVLEIEKLSFWYGNPATAPATLDAVSLSVGNGEVVALVGESGSGKSTLISSVIGLHASRNIAITAQALRFQGRDLLSLGHRDWRLLRGREIGYVSQDPTGSLNPLVPVGRQIVEVLRLYWPGLTVKQAEDRALESMRLVGFSEPKQVYSRYPHQLSGGMNQRISIVMALCGDPALLLADEPTSALDVSVQKRVLDQMAELVGRTGTALLFITHDLAVAADRAERVVVLKNGAVAEAGDVRQVLQAPRHDYTRTLLGAASFLGAPAPAASSAALTIRREASRADATADGGEALLDISGVYKTFTNRDGRSFAAVNHVSLSLGAGETVCVVGESGSGKTTLARAILKLADIDGGAIRFNGYDVQDLRGQDLKRYRREAQMVYQNPFASLDLRYSAEAILREPLTVHRIGDRHAQRARISRIFDLVGLPQQLLSRRPGELSGGQRQRVAIARALITSPRMLVLDEAVSALDVSVQARILDLLRDIQGELGIAYLFITHNLSVVQSFSDRVYVMKAGEIVESGATALVFADPQHPYTRMLLAAAPGQLAREKIS